MHFSQACAPLHRYYPLIGRVLIGILFALAGLSKIQSQASITGTSEKLASVGLPGDVWFVYLVALFELGAGIALIVGAFVHEVAYLLIGFTFLATLLYHTDFSGPNAMTQQVMFLKNLAIMGGLLLVAATGAGPWSVDAWRATKSQGSSSEAATQAS